MALVLRHDPAAGGITLDSEGWTPVEDLLRGLAGQGYCLSRTDIEKIVAEDSKGRYALSEDGLMIRANQGHSTKDVSVTFDVATPPEFLYHGTVAKFIDAIKAEGLKKMSRHHVHLSEDIDTAQVVGGRRGSAIILRIEAARMAADGHTFYRSENGVWLVDAVPHGYLSDI